MRYLNLASKRLTGLALSALSYLNGNGPVPGLRAAPGISSVDMATLRRINVR